MATIDRDGAVIWYETLGNEGAPPVVLLHDAGADLRTWTPAAQRLAGDYWLILVDLRGHGLSEWPAEPSEPSLGTYVDDVGAILGELGVELCAVAGMGFGALIALRMALQEPERVAAVVAAGRLGGVLQREDGGPEAPMSAAASTMEKYGATSYGKRLAATIRNAYLAAGVSALYQEVQTDGVLSALAAMAPAALEAREVAALSTPTMVGTGELGAGSEAGDRLEELLPAVWRVRIRDAGDDAAVTHADAFADQMARFFGAVEQGLPIENRVTV